jgi:hypothetical protein
MSEDEIIQAALAEGVSQGGFHHRDHVRLAWRLSCELGVDAGPGAVARAIQHIAAHHGEPAKYHETLTQFWARVVGHHVEIRPELTDFEQFIAAYPQLLDKDLPSRHWRHETLHSKPARAAWVEPDLVALPRDR